jgi:hypothetical protein
MDERNARLRTHQKNIDRYQGLLQTQLSETEKRYIEKRLFEERFAVAMLVFMSPLAASKADNFLGKLE